MLEHNMQQQLQQQTACGQTVVKIEFLKGSSFSREWLILGMADIVLKMSCYTIFWGGMLLSHDNPTSQADVGGKTHLQVDELSWMRSYRSLLLFSRNGCDRTDSLSIPPG